MKVFITLAASFAVLRSHVLLQVSASKMFTLAHADKRYREIPERHITKQPLPDALAQYTFQSRHVPLPPQAQFQHRLRYIRAGYVFAYLYHPRP